MGGAKPWQIALIALAIVVLLGSLAWRITHSESVDLAQEFLLVDVETGQLYKVHRPSDRSLPVPATNPDTQKDTLFPVEQTNGDWIVGHLYRSMLSKESAAVEDVSAGKVRVSGDPKRLDLFK